MNATTFRRHAALPPQRPRVEPVETDDPINAALDALEQMIRNIMGAGGEHALRARLRRLLPPQTNEV